MGEGWASLAARVVKNPPPKAGGARDTGSILGLGRCPGIGNGSPLPGRFHGQRNLAGSSLWGLKALDMPGRRSAAALRKWSKEEEEMGFRELN